MYRKNVIVNYITDEDAHYKHVATLLDAVQIGIFTLKRSASLTTAVTQTESQRESIYLLDCHHLSDAHLRFLTQANEFNFPIYTIFIAHSDNLKDETRAMAAGAFAWLEYADLTPRHLRRIIHQALFQAQTVRMLTDVHYTLQATQRDLMAERDLLRAVIDYSPDYIFAKNTDLRFIISNVAHAQSVQAEPDELLGKRALDFFPEALAKQYEADDQSILDSEAPLVNALRQTQDREGNLRHVLTTKIPLRDEVSGELRGLVGVSRDVTQRIQLEQEIKASEKYHRSIINAMQEGIVVHGLNGEIIGCNAAAERVLGLSFDQMQDRTSIDPMWRTIHLDGSDFPGEAHPAPTTLITGEPQYDVILGVYTPDDDLRWLNINSQPLTDETGAMTGAVATFTDITTLLEAQDQAREAAIHQERVKLIADFLYSASHEFRTPLSIIQTSLYLIDRAPEPAQRQRHLAKADEAIDRINRLVDMLLLLAKLDAITELIQQPVQISTLVQQMIQQWQRGFDEHGIAITVDLQAELPRIQGHASYLLQAFEQIIDNALKNMGEGDQLTICGRHDPSRAEVVISIADTGAGIEAKDLSQVFQRFWRKDDSHTTPGFGLGMPIAQRIITLHGGTITLDSEVGVGTTVTIGLPIGD